MYMGGVVKDCMENKKYKRKCIKKYCNGPWPGLYYSRPLAGTYPIGLMI